MWDIEREVRRRAAIAAGDPRGAAAVPEPRVVGGYGETPGFVYRRHLESVISAWHSADVAAAPHPPRVNVERDVLDRLERAGVGYFVTGSEALSVWAEPRQTIDIDIVTDLPIERYDAVIRPAFQDDYLVNDLIVVDGSGYGSVILEPKSARPTS